MLICMKNFPVNGPILDNQSEDSYIAWLDLKQQDENEPWLFYGEDEDFINAAWTEISQSVLIASASGNYSRERLAKLYWGCLHWASAI